MSPRNEFFIFILCLLFFLWVTGFKGSVEDARRASATKYYVVEGVRCNLLRGESSCGKWLEDCSNGVVFRCAKNVQEYTGALDAAVEAPKENQ